MLFFRGYHPSELDEDGKPLPNTLGPALVTLFVVAVIVGAIILGKAVL